MSNIKFGTDGWRAVIAKEFTTDNVARVSTAVSEWLKKNFDDPSVVIGHDCRFGGELFMETCARVFVSQGIKVKMARGFVSTPMVSVGTLVHQGSIGVVLTASHNPPEYNGYKLKGHFGGPLVPEEVKEVEDLIPETNTVDLDNIFLDEYQQNGMIEEVDLEKEYCDKMKEHFDLQAIRDSGLRLAYDPMYGAGQNVLKHVMPEVECLHCEYNPTFYGQAPEPIDKNLQEFAAMIKEHGNIDCGLATDGDADRIGLYNGKGQFIDSHHIILLLIHYLCKYKGLSGKVVTAFSTTVKVKKMCEHYGLEHETVKIGFKHICGIMIKEDVLLGGEESGGIAIKGHVPERDGIWMGMELWEFMAKSGRSLDDLIQEVYEIVGEFAFQRNDLHLKEDVKQRIVENCKQDAYKQFGNDEVQSVETLDGFKYFFNDDEWLMIRPSGTEPVLRTYAEGRSKERAQEILEACKETILEGVEV